MRGKRLLELIRPGTGERLSFKTKSYYIYPDGRVWNHKKRRYVAQCEIRGYMAVNLFDDEGKHHTSIYVHNLVATCFIRSLEKGVNVHHINHDRRDNRLENLTIVDGGEHSRIHGYEKWSSGRMEGIAAKISEKIKKAWATGAYEGNGEKVAAKLRNVGTSRQAKQVAQLSLDGQLIKVWPSTAECQRNGFLHGSVSACCLGKQKSHKKFKWMFYKDFLAQQPTAREQWNSRQLFLAFSE